MGPAKIDHQKLAIRKKSTFFRFSTPNFNTQLVIPISLHKKNLVKIGVRLPPEIKVQTEMELSGTYGILIINGGRKLFIASAFFSSNDSKERQYESMK